MLKTPIFKVLRQGLLSLVGVMAMTVIGILIAGAAIRSAGSLEQWQVWSQNNYAPLLAWRVLLYAVLTYCWFRLDPMQHAAPEDRARLRVLQAAAVLLVVLVELVKAPIAWEGLL